MIITKHGNNIDPFYKGMILQNQRTLVFFGYSQAHVLRKTEEWLFYNEPVGKSRAVVGL